MLGSKEVTRIASDLKKTTTEKLSSAIKDLNDFADFQTILHSLINFSKCQYIYDNTWLNQIPFVYEL